LERERLELEEKERKEKERQEKLEKKRLEKEQRTKERHERERIEREERERKEKEEKERKERERQERFERRRLEKEQKMKRFGLQSPQLSEIAKEDEVYKQDEDLINDNNILDRPIKKLYITKKNDYMNLGFDDDEMSKEIEGMDDKKRFSFRTDNYKTNTYKNEDSINQSKTFKKGRPTKVKVFKCVVWKNTDPTIDEETIKNFLHRSGSQIFQRGGFLLKLPQKSVSQKK
jgi:hypothetical protein